MKRSHPMPSEKKIRRRWRIPPALIHGNESLEGGCVLQEISGEAGLLLWQALRDVMLWANTPAAERAGLFSPEAERKRLAGMLSVALDEPIEKPLGVITAMVGRPARVSGEQVALACQHVSRWAEDGGHLATALAFAQAGALACPGDAASAFKVGQIARKRAENARAESWFRRTVGLARQAGDWSSYALAFLGLGTLYMQRGNFPAARRFYARCLRAARRHKLRDTIGCANHDMLVITVLSGNTEGVEQFAREAFEAYGPTNQRLPRLAHDMAYFWMTQGYFDRASLVLQALLPHSVTMAERLTGVSNLARAAGATGQRDIFDEMWSRTLELIEDNSVTELRAEAWLELAHGAVSLEDWERAAIAAENALEIARARGEARIQIVAEAVLDSSRIRKAPAPATRERLRQENVDEGEGLAKDLVTSLSSYAMAGR